MNVSRGIGTGGTIGRAMAGTIAGTAAAARRRLSGADAIARALRAGRPVQRVFVRAGSTSPEIRQLVSLCAERGVPVRHASARELLRLSASDAHAAPHAVPHAAPHAAPHAEAPSGARQPPAGREPSGTREAPGTREVKGTPEAAIPAPNTPAPDTPEPDIPAPATPEPDPSDEMLALEGLAPDAPLDAVLRAPGPVWLLTGVAYPGNAGFAIRTAEVSGAAGIAVDADFDHAGRRQALRTSMRADRLFPVRFAAAHEVVAGALAAGRDVIGIEDAGDASPWDVDLTGPVLFVVGGEARGISPATLARCTRVVRIPMPGFIPSYNLQAAVAIVAGEHLRQSSGLAGGRAGR